MFPCILRHETLSDLNRFRGHVSIYGIAKENIVIHQCTGGLLHSYYNIIIINSLVLLEINSDIFKLSP